MNPREDADLLNYGYALLSTSLELLEIAQNDSPEQVAVAQQGRIESSYALEAAARNAASGADLAFHGLVAGAASRRGVCRSGTGKRSSGIEVNHS